jgi:hypothetical protein
MKRFWTGFKIGALLVAGLSQQDLWVEMTSISGLLGVLVWVVAGALLVGTAFAIRRWHLPILAVGAIFVLWWQVGWFDHYFEHFFGYPADGFARTVAWSGVAIAAIVGSVVMTLRAASRNYD